LLTIRSAARAGLAIGEVPLRAGIVICAVLVAGGVSIRAQAPSTPAAPSSTTVTPAETASPGHGAFARRAGGDSGAEGRRLQRLSRFLMARSRNVATAELGGGEVIAHVGKLPTDGDDYRGLAALAPGDVLELPGAAACKLRNEVGLRFGDAVVPIGNASPGYAGLYSFWLRAPAAGSEQWSLIWNDEADVWGTQRDPARDRVEVPIALEKVDEEAKELTVAIEVASSGDAGTFELRWGTHRWRAPFSVAR
jgi:hypothetical protein